MVSPLIFLLNPPKLTGSSWPSSSSVLSWRRSLSGLCHSNTKTKPLLMLLLLYNPRFSAELSAHYFSALLGPLRPLPANPMASPLPEISHTPFRLFLGDFSNSICQYWLSARFLKCPQMWTIFCAALLTVRGIAFHPDTWDRNLAVILDSSPFSHLVNHKVLSILPPNHLQNLLSVFPHLQERTCSGLEQVKWILALSSLLYGPGEIILLFFLP